MIARKKRAEAGKCRPFRCRRAKAVLPPDFISSLPCPYGKEKESPDKEVLFFCLSETVRLRQIAVFGCKRESFWFAFVGSGAPSAALPSAIKRKPAVCLLGFECAFGGVPYGKGLRAPPCTRKGPRPLTRDCASRSACFCGFGGAPTAYDRLSAVNASRSACLYGFGGAFGGVALRQGFAGSALHPQGTSSLDP